MPGTWSSMPSVCSSRRTVAFAQCIGWADRGSAQCTGWADRGSYQCTQWADQGSSQCTQWADEGSNHCCTWAPCSWFCSAFYWVAKWVCLGWYWVAKWVCLGWYWVAKWVCLGWIWFVYVFCSGNAGPVWLLTDGSLLLNENAGGYGTHRWWRLTPDSGGNYAGGTWLAAANSNVARKYFASAVLADGRLIVSGGEYSDASGSQKQDESTTTEIYDPLTDAWTVLPAPPGATQIGDATCVVLPTGEFFLGEIDNRNTFAFTPGPDTWAARAMKGSNPSEESWVLMPEGSVVSVQTRNPPNAEKYIAATDTWVSAGSLPADIVETSSLEIGPGVLMPDGRAFFVGANAGNTAVYTQGATPTATGSWAAGPAIPNRPGDSRAQGSKDGPAALMPGGSVLLAVAPVDGVSGDYLSPSSFFEYDGVNLTRVADPPNADCATYFGRLLPLPNGQVLWAREDNDDIYVYTNTAAPQDDWRPVVTSWPSVLVPGSTESVSGLRFNGLSQAQGYGDDYAAATNYPLVRVRNVASGIVRYCRTHDHTVDSASGPITSMGVATGDATVTTRVDLPADLATGPSELVVVANGIPSLPVRVTVGRERPGDRRPADRKEQHPVPS
jgi:hypothetical protein